MHYLIILIIITLLLLGFLLFRKSNFIIVDLASLFKRGEIQEFINESIGLGFPKEFVEDFIKTIYTTWHFKQEPMSVNLKDDLISKWGCDDDKADLINIMLRKENIQKVKWNNKDVLRLKTIFDLMNYTYNKIKSEKSN
jgi:hypothetical protein